MKAVVSGIALACVVLMPISLSAQSSGSGIAGVVRDVSGAVLPGVTVEAASPALIEKVRTVVTNEQGQYKIVDLRPGTYTVTFTLSGFSTLKREGIELTANFTAAVNADLQVGALEETITVSGASPVVDVQNVTQQKTMSRSLVDSLPVNRGNLGYASLMPAVISPPNAQDVGGSKGEMSVRFALHGGKQSDQKLLVDGLRYNSLGAGGTGNGFYPNPAISEEVLIELAAGGSAEFATGGVHVDIVPKDGGNKFTGYFLGNYTNHALEGENSSEELVKRGLETPSSVQLVFDVNGAFGGPLSRNRVWFYTAHRRWGKTSTNANLFHDANLNDLIYTPDLTRPADSREVFQTHTVRLTAQVKQKHKLSFLGDYERTCDCQRDLALGGNALEAVNYALNAPSVTQGSWSFPATNKILFSAAASFNYYRQRRNLQDGVTPATISILEQTTNFRYGAPVSSADFRSNTDNERFSVSYVTGAHTMKVGMFRLAGTSDTATTRADSGVSYTFRAGVPIQLTEYVTPLELIQTLNPELAVYGQDQWTLHRLTLNMGLRFEYLRAVVPGRTHPATPFVGERTFDEVNCVPCWTDLSPRLGVAYDLFGTGKTALKGSIGRKYTAAETTTFANTFDPANTSINNVNRAWTDTNGNFSPDCDLRNPLGNGECQPISNPNFGKVNITTAADPDVLKGWGRRGFDWQASAILEHQVNERLAVNAGYYRTWYGNFRVTDNLGVAPEDYDPYCVTAPVDPRLPGGGGNKICGFYDLKDSKFGQPQNSLITFASKYGKQTEVYNGVDLNTRISLPHDGVISGGMNVGNSVSTATGLGVTTSSINRCFVVDSPQELYQCEVNPPYQPRFKILVVYPLPWGGIQASANFQNLPGAPITASYSETTAEIAKTLGRPLSGGTRTATVQLIQPFSEFEGRISQLDARLTKKFQVGRARVQALFDVYNLLNASPVLAQNVTYGPDWLKPIEILNARLFKFGVQMEF